MWLQFAFLLAQKALAGETEPGTHGGGETPAQAVEGEGMLHFKEVFEGAVANIATLLALAFEAVAVFCVLMALVIVFQTAFKLMMRYRHRQSSEFPFVQIRTILGSWLGLALEFQLAADILGTTVAPTFEKLGKLAIIALIRTFLNFFLTRELAELKEHQHHAEITQV